MNISPAVHAIRAMMDDHGLGHWGLTFSARMTKTLGYAAIDKRKIVISTRFVEVNEWPAVEQVALHEIAHALVREEHGAGLKAHGREWQNAARRIGVKQISGKMHGVVSAPTKYVGECSSTCKVVEHSRERLNPKHKHAYFCKRCKHPITWFIRETGREA